MQEIKQTARHQALADMREMVADGSLRIRQMTAEERVQHPPRFRATATGRQRAS